MIAVGRMAERFGMLPHQVEQNATTYDLMIVDVLATYDEYQKNKDNPSFYKEDDLKSILEQSRNG